MAVEEMKLLSIIGKEKCLDLFIEKYLLNSGLQPENALKILSKGWKLSYLETNNEIGRNLKLCKSIMKNLDVDIDEKHNATIKQKIEDIKEELEYIDLEFKQISSKLKELKDEKQKITENSSIIYHIRDLNVDLEKLYNLRYIRFRFGRIPKKEYIKLKNQISNINIILFDLEYDEQFVWIIYFTTKEFSKEVDSYLNVMKFERVWIPSDVLGTPKNFMEKSVLNIRKIDNEINSKNKELEETKIKYKEELKFIYRQLKIYQKINIVKKYVAHDKKGSFYIVGWIPNKEAEILTRQLNSEKDIEYVIKNNNEVEQIPPTNLKNNILFKPFETLVKMYGLPNYKELDPTSFVAITAFLMFGFMFGDVGQGLIILIIGYILYKRKTEIGPLLLLAGISSIIFGFIYGSIFGKENIIPSLLISPMNDITTMLISGIVVGVLFIIIAMIINIRNGIKEKNKEKVYLDQNGIPGIVFYLLVMTLISYFVLKGKLLVSGGILAITLAVPLLIILFKNPISRLLNKNKEKIKSSILETIFEMLETIISFISNTISFVRLAAFTINHIGLCMAIYILANMLEGVGNLFIVIIGNILVIGLEGLIVTIQVLRLEYYELFSRFYSGNGKEYKPIKKELV